MQQAHDTQAAAPARELAFIDAGVSDAATLLRGLRHGVEAVLLQGDRPPAAQMADAIRGRDGLDAIHIVSHGRPGEVAFGGGSLSRSSPPV